MKYINSFRKNESINEMFIMGGDELDNVQTLKGKISAIDSILGDYSKIRINLFQDGKKLDETSLKLANKIDKMIKKSLDSGLLFFPPELENNLRMFVKKNINALK